MYQKEGTLIHVRGYVNIARRTGHARSSQHGREGWAWRVAAVFIHYLLHGCLNRMIPRQLATPILSFRFARQRKVIVTPMSKFVQNENNRPILVHVA